MTLGKQLGPPLSNTVLFLPYDLELRSRNDL